MVSSATPKVILVPGTFDMKRGNFPTWSDPGEALTQMLVANGFTDIDRFRWSTANSSLSRYRAAARLARKLDREACPTILVGYSHGGSVSLMASNIAVTKPLGLVTIATPFIFLRRPSRAQRSLTRLFVGFVAFGLTLIAGLLGLNFIFPGRQCGADFLSFCSLFELVSGFIRVAATFAISLLAAWAAIAVAFTGSRRATVLDAKTRGLMKNNSIPKCIIYLRRDEALGWLRYLSAPARGGMPDYYVWGAIMALLATIGGAISSLVFGADQIATYLLVVAIVLGVAGLPTVTIVRPLLRTLLSAGGYGFGEAVSTSAITRRRIGRWPLPKETEDVRLVFPMELIPKTHGFAHSRIMRSGVLAGVVSMCLKSLAGDKTALGHASLARKHIQIVGYLTGEDANERAVEQPRGRRIT